MMLTGHNAPVLYGWQRRGSRYLKIVSGHEFAIIRCTRPEASAYGPAGQVFWQVEIDGRWPHTDPFERKADAVDWFSDGLHFGWIWESLQDAK